MYCDLQGGEFQGGRVLQLGLEYQYNLLNKFRDKEIVIRLRKKRSCLRLFIFIYFLADYGPSVRLLKLLQIG